MESALDNWTFVYREVNVSEKNGDKRGNLGKNVQARIMTLAARACHGPAHWQGEFVKLGGSN